MSQSWERSLSPNLTLSLPNLAPISPIAPSSAVSNPRGLGEIAVSRHPHSPPFFPTSLPSPPSPLSQTPLHSQPPQTLHVCHICLHWGGFGGQCRHIWHIHGVFSPSPPSRTSPLSPLSHLLGFGLRGRGGDPCGRSRLRGRQLRGGPETNSPAVVAFVVFCVRRRTSHRKNGGGTVLGPKTARTLEGPILGNIIRTGHGIGSCLEWAMVLHAWL